MRIALLISLICLSSCVTLKPTDYIYQIVDGKPCYFDDIKDLEKKNPKKFVCKDMKELEGWLVVHKEKWKSILSEGIDKLVVEKSK